MSESVKKDEKVVARETAAKTRQVMVRLDEFVMLPETYCHRGPTGLDEENVSDLFESLKREGLQVPVEFYTEEDGRKVLIKGHRRVTACTILARDGAKHFSLDMEIPAVEVLGAPRSDRVVRATLDNTKRKSYDNNSRIRAAMVLHREGVSDSRAADALDYSEQSFKRDLLVGRHEWMFNHVVKEHVGSSQAADIIKAAEEANRLDDVRAQFDAWVAKRDQEIQKKIAMRKTKGLKELSGAEKLVKSKLTGPLVKRWVEQIKAGQPLEDQADFGFRAGIDPDTHELTVGNYKTNADKEAPKNLVLMAAQMSQVIKEIIPLAKKRLAEEKQGTDRSPAAAAPFDLDLLRQEGLGEYADELEEQLRQQAAQDGEDDPDRKQVEERKESDLASTIQLPASGDSPTPGKSEPAPPVKPPTEQPEPKAADNTKPAQ